MTLRDKLSAARDRAAERLGGSDSETRVQQARRRATRRKLKRRAKSAASKVPTEMSNREVASKLQSAGEHVASAAPDEAPERTHVEGNGFGQSSRDVAARAEHAATVADPVGASLDPADPSGVDEWAKADDAGIGSGQDEELPGLLPTDADAPASDPLSVEDDFFGAPGGESEGDGDDDPMAFDDPFGLGGGED